MKVKRRMEYERILHICKQETQQTENGYNSSINTS